MLWTVPGASIRRPGARGLFAAAVWLALTLVAAKAYYLGAPGTHVWDYLRSLAAISYVDVLFVVVVWTLARTLLALGGRGIIASRIVSLGFLSFSAACCVYAFANVLMFGTFGGFLTYPLLSLIGDVQMLMSSVTAYLTPGVVIGLVLLPLTYLALVVITVRLGPPLRASRQFCGAVALVCAVVWVGGGQLAFTAGWATRQDRRIAENPQWAMVSSWWQVVTGLGAVHMADRFAASDLADFEPIGSRPPVPVPVRVRRASMVVPIVRTPAVPRPVNVILLVLESVAARWTGLNGGPYDTTPALESESTRALVFDNFYAHIGRSSNSLTAILLSAYPKLGFRDMTEEFPRLQGTSLASVFRARGYRTGFLTPSDLSWAGWDTFFDGRGFDQIRDDNDLTCSAPVSSWGVEDRCAVEGMVDFINQEPGRPFFLMAWTQQTHHPYEPTPGLPMLDFKLKPSTPDAYDLERYLNVLHETDHQIGRLFEALRRTGLDSNTLVVVTGDHGQAFGSPHNSYGQGRTAYEEDVHVPLMFWFPPQYRTPVRSKIVGSHVDLAPTITDVVGLPPAPDWQGRSLLDPAHPPRAYFYVAEDQFTLGIREGNWKYLFNLREGIEELYDLDHDPTEQQNLAASQPGRTTRLRQRLAAWTEADRREYEQPSDRTAKSVQVTGQAPAPLPVTGSGRSVARP